MPTAVLALVEGVYNWMNDLFGWIVSLGMSGRLGWIARDWKAFVLGIVIFGLAIDMVVYIARYRPDRAWRAAIVRLFDGQRKNKKTEAHGQPVKAREKGETNSQPAARKAAPIEEPTLSLADARRAKPEPPTVPRAAPRAPTPRPKAGPSSAELFQPAPPMEGYDGEPTTFEPGKSTPNWKKVDD